MRVFLSKELSAAIGNHRSSVYRWVHAISKK